MSEPKFPEVNVKLVGEDGNAFAILRRVAIALHEAGHADQVDQFYAEAEAGNYDNLLRVCTAWVSCE